jgi:NAD(P)H-hydrate epimerase
MLVSAKQIQKLDDIAINRFGIPSLALMENAGRAVAAHALGMLKMKKRVCIVCGSGNNAGDGFVAARHLINKGCRVTIVLVGKASSLKNDAAVNFAVLKRLKIPIVRAGTSAPAAWRKISGADLVIDAIFGVGLNRTIDGPAQKAIAAINAHAGKVLSVDVPSGLDATSGGIHGVCVKADATVTFTLAKMGFGRGEGPAHCGNVLVADIGIPKALYAYRR